MEKTKLLLVAALTPIAIDAIIDRAHAVHMRLEKIENETKFATAAKALVANNATVVRLWMVTTHF